MGASGNSRRNRETTQLFERATGQSKYGPAPANPEAPL